LGAEKVDVNAEEFRTARQRVLEPVILSVELAGLRVFPKRAEVAE